MHRAPVRPVLLLVSAVLALCCASCQKGPRFYPVRGYVFVNGKPAEGASVVFHPQDGADLQPAQPAAVVQKDGSFALQTWVVQQRVLKTGAPAGRYLVTCVWYPPDLDKYLGMEVLPDKLGGRYAVPKQSGLRAEVPERATELPPFELELPTRK
jgi:hypothetical protein